MKLWITIAVIPLALLLGCAPTFWSDLRAPAQKTGDIAAAEPVTAVVIPYHAPAVGLGDAASYTPPDFTVYGNLQAKKQAFYSYLLPRINKVNEEIVQERRWLLSLRDKILAGRVLAPTELAHLRIAERRYNLQGAGTRNVAQRVGDLLVRVDVVPASLVLAQAAKESGWGTSRFARQGNNFFGIWCFYEGCGMTPLRREAGRSHEVAIFPTVEDGVRYYMRTINTHSAYQDLRRMRAAARRQDRAFGGEQLAVGLSKYSERGDDYVKEIQSLIRHNNLHRFTRQPDSA